SMRRKNRESVQGYFLAGRTMHWIPIGASLFASNIGSEHFVGLAGSGAASGIAVANFELGAVLLLLLLGWVFLPIYLKAQVFTIPEYLGRRFGGYRMRIYLSSVALALYVLTKISVDVYAGGIFIQQATGWNIYLSMIPLLIVTALYTLAGGLAAVVFTDTFQTVVMLGGAVFLASMAYAKVGGLEALYFKYMEAVPSVLANATTSNSTCGKPRHDAFHLFRDPLNSDLPWPGVLARATLASLWYWCSDQIYYGNVSRELKSANSCLGHCPEGACCQEHGACKSCHADGGLAEDDSLVSDHHPGMISRVVYPDMVACADPDVCMSVCNNPSGCSNVAYPLLILKMAPAGVRGLLMAVMVAALMSSLTSVFNSAATLFTMDVWRKVRPSASEKQLLIVGSFLSLVQNHSVKGAFWGVLAGQATGITRLVLDFLYPAPGCGEEDTRPAIVARVHFTYFSVIVLAVTATVAMAIRGLTWWTLRKEHKPQRTFGCDMLISATL
ncbi:hypothetical protein C0Q70_05903, partial [Pomacea canaliculata]